MFPLNVADGQTVISNHREASLIKKEGQGKKGKEKTA